MLRRCLAVCLSAGLCAAVAGAQYDNDANHTVAYIYVSANPPNSSDNQIEAFAVHEDGRLLSVTGSPFRFDVTSLSTNGNRLFAVKRTAPYINAYSIQWDGALEYLSFTDYAIHNLSDCGSAGWLFPDRTSADLYAMNFDGDCANNTYQSFSVQGSTGKLNYLGVANGGAGSFSGVHLPLTFLGNNTYAYEANNNSCLYYSVWGFHREPDGLLTGTNISVERPAPPSNYRIYIPTFAAADPFNHVAISLLPANPPGCSDEKAQIASFTASTNGNLTTTNTHATMPTTSITNVTDMKISPAGNLIAVGGGDGLQLFHFNGASPVTPYTGILTVDPVTQMFWDRGNHLFAISRKAGRLHVFTITPTGYHEAPGSPYPIHSPEYMTIHALH